jgi:hypothetical protein
MSDVNKKPGFNPEVQSMDELKTSFNQQTSKISWQELQRFYASGAVIAVAPQMDLIEVACQFSLDNQAAVADWLQEGSVFKVDDQHAQRWYEKKSTHWAVVVDPWVLTQEIVAKDGE